MHAVEMWIAYMALEPYVRRLWPRMLVSWTRLVSGRLRDPLVGRDLLLGGAIGSALTAIGLGAAAGAARLGLSRVPTQLGDSMLESLTSLANTGCYLSYAGSVCVLNVLQTLVLLLVLRLVLRRTWAAVVVTAAFLMALMIAASLPNDGWMIAIVNAAMVGAVVWVLMRFGLLATVVSSFVVLVMGSVVASLDLSSWYADRALVPAVLLVGLLIYGAATALAGRPILGDPLRDGGKM
jgi:serine/threonine-protein kinase